MSDRPPTPTEILAAPAAPAATTAAAAPAEAPAISDVAPPLGTAPAAPGGAPSPAHDEIPGLRAMAIVRWAILILVASLAAGTWWVFAIRGAPVTDTTPRYHCPMHPQITSPVPGTCPICGMRLEPIPEELLGHPGHDVHAGAPAADAGAPVETVPVMLTLERRQRAGIASVPAVRRAEGRSLRLPATVEVREGSIAEVRVRTRAFVERAPVRETGVRVRAGQVLAWVYAPEIVAAQEELLVASRWSGTEGEALAARARERLALFGVGARDLDGIVASGHASRSVPVRSPISGWITERSAVVGASAEPDVPLYVVADLSRVWVVASTLPGELATSSIPETARFVTRDGAQTAIRRDRIVPQVERAARTGAIRFLAENPDLALLPGAIGEVLVTLEATDQLLVPRDALIDTGRARYVFVDRGEGLFEPRPVETGPLLGDERAILSGLSEGERVVVRGTFVLDSESRFQAALAPAAAGSAAPGPAPGPAPAAGGHVHGGTP